MTRCRVSGTRGMPEGAEVTMGSLEIEVDGPLDAQQFRCPPSPQRTQGPPQLKLRG